MLLFNLFNNPIEIFVVILALLTALTIHEFSHAWLANYLGDSTAKRMGRVSLNPIVHLDFLGTIFLLLAGFGWGKPVIVNPNNFKNPKLDNLTVSLAGPISNLLLASILGLVYRFLPGTDTLVLSILKIFIEINLILMIFNLLPIPPLDGSKIISIFTNETTYMAFQQIGIILLFILIIFSSSIPVIPLLFTKTLGFFFSFITGKPL